jgi:ABC-type multidrug transport system fused ATPase/permease subunit
MPITAACGNTLLNTGALDLEIEDLCFSYENGNEVIKAVNLTIPAGARIGIMGETGCGKSTLITLIARLNSVGHGVIRLGGVDICAIDSKNFRNRVAYCTQRVQLVHGTLRDNITLFNEGCSDMEIFGAVELLGLTDWFRKFPNGLDTMLEMGEGNISSGETQLIALVRLALRQPGMVLLDEISSNLDAVTEKRIMQAVRALCEGRTVIAIAHRAEALDWMDTILRMDNGVLFITEKK